MIQLYNDERIIKQIRRHWFVIFLDVILFLFIVVIPFVMFEVFLKSGQTRPIPLSENTIMFLYSVWVLFAWNIMVVAWTTNYYLDVILITNRRLLRVEQLGLFARNIAEMRLEKIQDIHIDIIGFIPSLLNFGNLEVQTAGEEEQFVLYDIPDPNTVKNIIFEHHDAPPIGHPKKSEL